MLKKEKSFEIGVLNDITKHIDYRNWDSNKATELVENFIAYTRHAGDLYNPNQKDFVFRP